MRIRPECEFFGNFQDVNPCSVEWVSPKNEQLRQKLREARTPAVTLEQDLTARKPEETQILRRACKQSGNRPGRLDHSFGAAARMLGLTRRRYRRASPVGAERTAALGSRLDLVAIVWCGHDFRFADRTVSLVPR